MELRDRILKHLANGRSTDLDKLSRELNVDLKAAAIEVNKLLAEGRVRFVAPPIFRIVAE